MKITFKHGVVLVRYIKHVLLLIISDVHGSEGYVSKYIFSKHIIRQSITSRIACMHFIRNCFNHEETLSIKNSLVLNKILNTVFDQTDLVVPGKRHFAQSNKSMESPIFRGGIQCLQREWWWWCRQRKMKMSECSK